MQTYNSLRAQGVIDASDFGESVDCRICLCPVEHAVTTACHHTFCRQCLRTWLRDNGTCPICRCDLAKAPESRSGVGNETAGVSNGIFDQPCVHAPTTLGRSVNRESIQLSSTILNTPPTQVVRDSNLPTSAPPESQCHTLGYQLSGRTSADGQLVTNGNRDRDQLPTTSFFPAATRQILTSRPPRASDDHAPTECQPWPRHGFDISRQDINELAIDDLEGHGDSITIDPQRLLVAMRSAANEMAHTRGISQCPDYAQAAKVVYKQCVRMLERKVGQTVRKYDLIWLLAEEMNLALAEARIVEFNRGEVLPRRLSRYLCDVARAAVTA